MVVVGRNLKFPIDLSVELHHMLISNPAHVVSFAGEQAALISARSAIARGLINAHRTYHRK